ncbi:MAG TPA: ATP-grasp domain-containing protein [Bacteroidales bacterium]|nr:ATP-grasp domain-containing protein [Bacteroidales bacterium]
MNILFTCAGRRNNLLQYFKEALNGRGKIIAADMEMTAPAMSVANVSYTVPGVYDKRYIESLLDICVKENIAGLISLNDLELPILASREKDFELGDVKLIISKPEVIDVCFDKNKTLIFGERLGIKVPKTALSLKIAMMALETGQMKLPLVVKPRWGSASIGIEFPETKEELELAYRLQEKKLLRSNLFEASKNDLEQSILIQEKINGIEYGLDVLNNFDGQPVQVYVKEKHAMRAGETDKAVLRNIPALEELGFRIGKTLGHIGNLDVDIFEMDGHYYLLEMNPRFGGGYPFSHMTGANYPAAIIAWLQNKPFDFSSFKKEFDQVYAKCDTLVRVG